ncbi:hypothetical protein ACLKMH_14300 [Psychromonas sp. KJ10-10]|uniref:hypothetical protein n=1 Tax=Psychromonas sp. KJ10-10 TaxID=3391823 RepID=UPI0039B50B48
MNEYKKSLWISNLIVLLFVALVTMACKTVINPLLIQHQEMTAQMVNASLEDTVADNAMSQSIVEQDLFNYIKINQTGVDYPLVYENHQLNVIDKYLSEIPKTTFISDNRSLHIEYIAKNTGLLDVIKKILFIFYVCTYISRRFL